MNKLNNKYLLPISNLNTVFLSKKCEDLVYLLDSTNFVADGIAISETILTRNKAPVNKLILQIYVRCTVQLNPQLVVLFYALETIFCTNNDLNIYKSTENQLHIYILIYTYIYIYIYISRLYI